jgi:hypothetical protein
MTMPIFYNLYKAAKCFIDSYSGEASLAVQEMIGLLKRHPDSFQLVREGKSLMIQSTGIKSHSRVRLDPWGITLSMEANDHVILSPKDSRLLNKAVHRWLS